MAARRRNRKRTARQQESSEIALPSVRTFRVWSPAAIEAAQISADSGYIRTAVDLCDWLLTDERIRGALDARVKGFLQLPVSFDKSGDRRRSGRAVKALEVGEDWWTMFPGPEARAVNVWALLLGLGPGVERWETFERHDGRDIPRLEFFHPQPFRYDWQQRTWLRRTETGTEEPVEFGDGLWLGHMPYGSHRPWAWGLWRSLAPWAMLKWYARNDYARLGEAGARHVVEQELGTPGQNVRSEGGGAGTSSKPMRRDLADKIRALHRDGVLILPPGFKYRTVEISAATKDICDRQITLANEAIAVNIRGGNLSTQVEGGSRAAAQVQAEWGDEANRRDDAGAWEDTTHDQSLVYWADSNFGDSKLAPWAKYQVEPEEDRQQAAEVFDRSMDAAGKAEKLGFALDRKAFSDRFGFSDFLKPGEKREPPDPTKTPPGQGDDDPDPDPTDDPDGSGGGGAAKAARRAGAAPRASAHAHCAHGAATDDDGQEYADRVHTHLRRGGARELAPVVASMVSAIDAGEDYESIRDAIEQRYRDMASPAELSRMVEAATVMTALGGRLAAQQEDADDEPDDAGPG